ncbi:hypothetical protein [Micromonospora sp. WMMD980]|uniref:hypothetical protein n=1 Tax=Micromonospora sp. WMMD980 TaxID=3016088 RepID=UPI002417C7BB|nr:hypothetical protein [Micromonospora sp. WMMD980]MDG4803699.1 hypothetical protein [Micromonospora sp. WMMD980]
MTAATLIGAVAAVSSLPPPPALPAAVYVGAADDCAVPSPSPHRRAAPGSAGVRLRPGGPARTVLLNLAGRIAAEACDATTGKFAVVRHHLWRYDAGGVQESDVVRWYAADESGAELAVRHPRQQVAPDWWGPGGSRAPRLADSYASGESLISGAQFDGWRVDPPALVDVLARLAMWHSPGRAQRQLAAQVLADAAGLTAHPATTDRAGRVGVGIAAFSERGRTRHLLILDAHSGQVLAYEAATLTASGWRSQVYLLLLTRTHAPRRWWEPPTGREPVAALSAYLEPHRSAAWFIHSDQPCNTDRDRA